MVPIMKNAVEVSHFNSVCFKHKITLSSMNIWVLWICVRIEISNAVVTLHDWMLTSVGFFFFQSENNVSDEKRVRITSYINYYLSFFFL